MIFAYADPPYIGQARQHYGQRAHEVNHGLLIRHLVDDYPDGWALSCHSPSLRTLLPLCPADVRVMPWVKTNAVLKHNVGVTYAWEPVVVRGGRRRPQEQRKTHDWVSAATVIRADVFKGAKPAKFCYWLFSVLNVQPGDELHDLFPGTGAVTKSLEAWMRQPVLTL